MLETGYPQTGYPAFFIFKVSVMIINDVKEGLSMDAGFKSGKNIFRYRVAMIIIEDDHLLTAKNNMSDYYYTLSGAVNLGESSENAARKLTLEMINENYDVERLLTIVENFFNYEFNDTQYDFHEITFYYLMEEKGRKDIIQKNDIGGGRKESFTWIPMNEIKTIEMRPEIVKEIIQKLPENVETIINDERI